jgi:hypothetical protein
MNHRRGAKWNGGGRGAHLSDGAGRIHCDVAVEGVGGEEQSAGDGEEGGRKSGGEGGGGGAVDGDDGGGGRG